MFRKNNTRLTLQEGVLISRTANSVTLMPMTGTQMKLFIESVETGGFNLIAKRGEGSAEVLGHYESERKARSVLSSINQSSAARSWPTIAFVAVLIPLFMFSAWFLFALPNDPNTIAQHDPSRTMGFIPNATAQQAQRPVAGVDPLSLTRQSPVARAAPISVQPVEAQPNAAQQNTGNQQNPFGLQ